MKSIQNFTAIIEKEDESYVALCPKPDVTIQGGTVEEAKKISGEQLNFYMSMPRKMK